jgi:hypothetical protein
LREVGKEIVRESEMARLPRGLIKHLKAGYPYYAWKECMRKGSGDRFTLIDFPKDPRDAVEIPHPHIYEPFAYGGQQYCADEVSDTSDDSKDDLDYEYEGYVSEEEDSEDEERNVEENS